MVCTTALEKRPPAKALRRGFDTGRGGGVAVRRDGLLTDVYASFRIESPGLHRVMLMGGGPHARTTPLYVRFGGRHYSRWAPPAATRESVVVLEAELEPGERLLELHSSSTKQPIDWQQLLVEPAGR